MLGSRLIQYFLHETSESAPTKFSPYFTGPHELQIDSFVIPTNALHVPLGHPLQPSELDNASVSEYRPTAGGKSIEELQSTDRNFRLKFGWAINKYRTYAHPWETKIVGDNRRKYIFL